RYYDPNIGRFISEDSYWGEDENPLSLNLYTYCANDPIRYTDPSGHTNAYLTDLAKAAGGSATWDSKKKVAVVNVNGIKKELKTSDFKNDKGKIVIDNDKFDKMFSSNKNNLSISIDTTVKNGEITGTQEIKYGNNTVMKTTLTGGESKYNPSTAKISPKPKENEKFSLEKGDNSNDVAVWQVASDAKGYMDMPLRSNGETIDYGYFGTDTYGGVLLFQNETYSNTSSANKNGAKLNYIRTDGTVDKETWKSLGLPVDKNGNPDRNSKVYKELLEVAQNHDTITEKEFYAIVKGSEPTKSSEVKGAGKSSLEDLGIMPYEQAKKYMYWGLFTKFYNSSEIKSIPKSISYMVDGKVNVYSLTESTQSFNGISIPNSTLKLKDGTIISTAGYSYEYAGKYDVYTINGITVLMPELEDEISYGIVTFVPGGSVLGEGAGKGQLGSKTGYKFKDGVDVDLRGTGKTYNDALDGAFSKTGTPKSEFEVTEWGKDANGKSFPVEWRAKNGAEVNIDIGHTTNGPDVTHVGYQTGGKRGSGGAARGHILVDDVPINR
ncbi:MAG: polymorphic toxin type 47 domain-containing protein, partial [Ruminiclostridium sp.]